MGLAESLVARCSLKIIFTVHLDILLQVDCIRVNRCLLLFDFLVHET
jgi:hypothetical protein